MRPTLLAAVLILAPLAIASDQPDPLPDAKAQAARIRLDRAIEEERLRHELAIKKLNIEYEQELDGAIKRASAAERFDAAKALMDEKGRIATAVTLADDPIIGTRWKVREGVTVEFGRERMLPDGPNWARIDAHRIVVFENDPNSISIYEFDDDLTSYRRLYFASAKELPAVTRMR